MTLEVTLEGTCDLSFDLTAFDLIAYIAIGISGRRAHAHRNGFISKAVS